MFFVYIYIYIYVLYIKVCSEESLNAIQDRYIKLNAHAKGYVWKRLGNLLDMNKTLEENNVADESKQFEMLGMDEDEYLPGKY